ncbi:scarecrow-like protein 15 [Pyrus communis]|uniref:scarecrow-like protein 15 n=1 Tax=Pyrus communis TaxID=23211 RepID=UPI0035C0BBA3
MRVPVSSPHSNNNNQSPKHSTQTNNQSVNFHLGISSLGGYEPTSVLDLRHSPSPVSAEKPSKILAISDVLSHSNHDPVEWEEQVDWDSIMRDLGWHDDNVPNLKNSIPQLNSNDPQISEYLHPQPFDPSQLVHSDYNINLSEVYSSQNCYDHVINDFHQSGNWNVGVDFIEELIGAADRFDSDELPLAQVILDRLNNRLRSSSPSKPVGKPLQRAAVYFKDALQSLLNGSDTAARELSSWSDIVETIRAYKGFSGISPVPMFSHFTTNQALLEALNGSAFFHVIDFDIGLGGQYASLMKELAEKADVASRNKGNQVPPVLRITAVVPEEYAVETQLIRENLSQFAQELKIRFQVEFVPVRTFEMMSFKAVKFMDGEKTAVLLSPYILRRLCSQNNISCFLGDMRRVSPSVVVFVDGEGMGDSGTTSFRRNFVSGLEFFSIMLESLDASVAASSDVVKKIETFLLRPKIQAAVEAAGRRIPPWREVFQGAGMRAMELSQFADFQAQCLLGKVQVRGFHVAKRQGELVLCWHDRALVATSAWRCS